MPRSADFLRKPDVFAVRLHVQRNTPVPTSGLRRTHRWKSLLTSIFGDIAERKQFVEASLCRSKLKFRTNLNNYN